MLQPEYGLDSREFDVVANYFVRGVAHVNQLALERKHPEPVARMPFTTSFMLLY